MSLACVVIRLLEKPDNAPAGYPKMYMYAQSDSVNTITSRACLERESYSLLGDRLVGLKRQTFSAWAIQLARMACSDRLYRPHVTLTLTFHDPAL